MADLRDENGQCTAASAAEARTCDRYRKHQGDASGWRWMSALDCAHHDREDDSCNRLDV